MIIVLNETDTTCAKTQFRCCSGAPKALNGIVRESNAIHMLIVFDDPVDDKTHYIF